MPTTTASPTARKHARDFLEPIRGNRKSLPPHAGASFLRAVESIGLPTVESDGDARTVMADAVKWINRRAGDEAPRGRLNEELKLPKLDRANTLLLATGYLRAVEALEDPVAGPKIREALRNPGRHRGAIRKKLDELETDFKEATIEEIEAATDADPHFKAKLNKAADDLRKLEPELRRIALSGEGREGSWIVGVAITCFLTNPWCLALGVVVIVGIVIYVVVSGK